MNELRFCTFLSFVYGKLRLVLTTAIIVMMLIEMYLRIPFILKPLEYQADSELGASLRPGQLGYVWIGNMSFQSPPISINSDGHRGDQTDWSKPVVLTVGDSENMGIGVEDDEVWTTRLELVLRQKTGICDIQVVNASHPGAGPYHQLIKMKRVLATDGRNIRLIIVRVDVGDRHFIAPSNEQLRKSKQEFEIKQMIRNYTKALPYLMNKLEAQRDNIGASFKPWFIRKERSQTFLDAPVGYTMWEDNKGWWREMVRLATSKNIPLIFMVSDIMEWPATEYIYNCLKKLSSDYKSDVFKISRVSLGLREQDSEKWWTEYYETMTLLRDMHANQLQHERIANALSKYLIEKHLIKRN
jgi:hypothetical protein